MARHLLRIATRTTAVLALAAMGCIFAARLPDQPVCLLLFNSSFSSPEYRLFDLNTGRDAPDPRPVYGFPGLMSPDQRYFAYPVQSGSQQNPIRLLLYENRQNPIIQPTEPAVLLDAIYPETGFFNWSMRMVWSPDSTRLAVLWSKTDSEFYLSILSITGEMLKSVHFERSDHVSVLNQTTMLDQWSADGNYLVIQEHTGNIRRYTFRSVDTLQPVTSPVDGDNVIAGDWSPSGSRYAAVIERNAARQLVIFTPGAESPLVTAPLDATPVNTVAWSPDGQHVTLAGLPETCTTSPGCIPQWHYSIFEAGDGQPVVGGMLGVRSVISAQYALFSNLPVSPLPPLWSADSKEWLFLREEGTDTPLRLQLAAFNVDSRTYRTIADRITPDLADQMFYTLPVQRNLNGPTLPHSRFLLLPTEQDGSYRVDLLDASLRRIDTLVDDAIDIIRPTRASGLLNEFWSGQRDWIIIPWRSGTIDHPAARLTLWETASSRRLDIDTGAVGLTQINRIGFDWLGFLALHPENLSLDMVNTTTGDYHTLLRSGDPVERWSVFPQPMVKPLPCCSLTHTVLQRRDACTCGTGSVNSHFSLMNRRSAR